MALTLLPTEILFVLSRTLVGMGDPAAARALLTLNKDVAARCGVASHAATGVSLAAWVRDAGGADGAVRKLLRLARAGSDLPHRAAIEHLWPGVDTQVLDELHREDGAAEYAALRCTPLLRELLASRADSGTALLGGILHRAAVQDLPEIARIALAVHRSQSHATEVVHEAMYEAMQRKHYAFLREFASCDFVGLLNDMALRYTNENWTLAQLYEMLHVFAVVDKRIVGVDLQDTLSRFMMCTGCDPVVMVGLMRMHGGGDDYARCMHDILHHAWWNKHGPDGMMVFVCMCREFGFDPFVMAIMLENNCVVTLQNHVRRDCFDAGDVKSVDMVVARYKEDLAWFHRPEMAGVIDRLRKIWVYNKGPDRNAEVLASLPERARAKTSVVSLPNVGRCDHTVLYHVLKERERLADVTIFTVGSCDMDYKWGRFTTICKRAIKTGDTALHGQRGDDFRASLRDFQLDEWKASHPGNASENPETALLPSPIRPFGKWFESFFGPNQPLTSIAWNGIFAVSKEHILQKDAALYARLISFVDTHSNPEAGHYTERSWEAIFGPMPESCK